MTAQQCSAATARSTAAQHPRVNSALSLNAQSRPQPGSALLIATTAAHGADAEAVLAVTGGAGQRGGGAGHSKLVGKEDMTTQ